MESPGIFVAGPGESFPPTAHGNWVVLDSGELLAVEGLAGVNHQERYVIAVKSEEIEADIQPPAVRLEHTEERRAHRYPQSFYEDENGNLQGYTRWGYFPGEEMNVQERPVDDNRREWKDERQYFDGRTESVALMTDTQPMTAWDFQWNYRLKPDPLGVRHGTFAGTEETTRTPQPGPLLVDGQTLSAVYRTQQLITTGLQGYRVGITSIQAHLHNVWLGGDMVMGQGNTINVREIEVTQVLEREGGVDGAPVTRTRVNAWMPIATLNDVLPAGAPPNPDKPPGDKEYDEAGTLYGYIKRTLVDYADVLRDQQGGDWRPGRTNRLRFTALDGTVTATFGLSADLGRLAAEETLTAFGQTFRGGSWAALRDTPVKRGDGTWDYSPLIILHASDTTVTAVRPDGQHESCTVREFEREVLRVQEGSFKHFGTVGAYSHSWPPEWAWCICQGDSRAVTAHDAWRDSYKRDPPDGSPEAWIWRTRPGKRPKRQPESAPRGLLGLTLADVTDVVTHDDPIPKGEGPLRPPINATTTDGADVLAKVKKRLPYRPAEIPDERDDTRSVRGLLLVEFGPLPPPPVPQPGQTAEHAAALYLRYRGKATSIHVNDVDVPLIKLGHNADETRGWHPYRVDVPARTFYRLAYEGQISQVGQIVRVIVKGGLDT